MENEKLLQRLDAYRSLLRHQYSDYEKLVRLKVLEDYYNSENIKYEGEKLSSSLDTAESLSKDLSLPLKVKGVFLTEGKPKLKYYPSEELMKSTKNPINNNFPLMLDHRDNEASVVIGKVDRIEYDESIKGIRWWGHINDETFARNVLDSIITQVSVTVYSTNEQSEKFGRIGRDLIFKELSLVMQGAEKYNSIEVDST